MVGHPELALHPYHAGEGFIVDVGIKIAISFRIWLIESSKKKYTHAFLDPMLDQYTALQLHPRIYCFTEILYVFDSFNFVTISELVVCFRSLYRLEIRLLFPSILGSKSPLNYSQSLEGLSK